MIDDGRLRELASRQHGVVSVEQAQTCGLGAAQRLRLVDGRRWVRESSRVLRLAGSPATAPSRAMATVLQAGPGAVLASWSACAWWGMPGARLLPAVVDRPRDRSARRVAGSAREPVTLDPEHIVVLEGIPVVHPARALFEVAGSKRRGAEIPSWVQRVARMVDTAWSMRLVSGPTLHAMLEDLAQRGRPGIRVMRQVLSDRPIGYAPPASSLESRVQEILWRAGITGFRRQVDTGSERRWIGRVDFRHVDLPLVLEVQSERFHTSLIDRQVDAERIEALERAGIVVVELLEDDVWHGPARVVAAVRAGLAGAEGRRAA
jgi:hypothetical protein